jgi:hypothetical protein
MTAWLIGSIVCVASIRSFSATARFFFVFGSIPFLFISLVAKPLTFDSEGSSSRLLAGGR